MIIILSEEGDGRSKIPTQRQRKLLGEAADLCLLFEGIISDDEKGRSQAENISVSLSFVDEEEIREMNSSFRDRDSVTDVLSFPMYENTEDIKEELENDREVSLGDVVICSGRMISQAAEYGHSQDRELVYLFVHSMLHLMGYDHMEDDDKKAMRTREEEIMGKLGIER